MIAKTDNFGALFSLLLIFSIVQSKNDCLTTFCGNKSLPIHYPFHLEGTKHQKGCDQNQAISLKCSNQDTNVPVLNLLNSGDFYIRNINYLSQTIQLYDPNNCLPSRFMKENFSVSPLIAANNLNYTFYYCPLNASSSNFTSIGCLSNSTFSVFATSSILRAQEMNNLGCNMIQTVPVPVSSPLQFEYNGFNADLVLTWNVPSCACGAPVKEHKASAGRVAVIIILALVLPVAAGLVIYLLVIYLIKLVKRIVRCICWIKRKVGALISRIRERSAPGARAVESLRQVSLPVVTPRPINGTVSNPAMKTIVIGESRRVPGPSSPDCAICMEEYNPGDTVKSKTRCEHYFHERCIDQWLRAHNSCPICRSTA